MKLYLLIILIFLFSEDTLVQSQIYKVQPGGGNHAIITRWRRIPLSFI